MPQIIKGRSFYDKPWYNSYRCMMSRCYREKDASYKNYGGRGIKVCDEDDDIIMISSDGVIIRIRTSDIRIMGRIAKGVRVMRVRDDVKVVAFTRAEHDENADVQEVEQLSEEELRKAQSEAELEEKNEVIIENEEPDDDENE
jgi:DNA gyrase subunit A